MSLFGFLSQSAGHVPLFNELCLYHKIDRKSRTLLNNIAQKFSPENPVMIFLDRASLQKAIADPEFINFADKINEFIADWFDK
ncbi:MAG: hypothetical protein LBT09_10335 [Planctomycetaceae bacterium]|jgi:hypothetical protein|nr:hypothetical protein [Planctomycetaceae bacterium]